MNSPSFLQKETCTEKLKCICTSAPFPKSLEETNKDLTLIKKVLKKCSILKSEKSKLPHFFSQINAQSPI